MTTSADQIAALREQITLMRDRMKGQDVVVAGLRQTLKDLGHPTPLDTTAEEIEYGG